jgi:hypothetical protein
MLGAGQREIPKIQKVFTFFKRPFAERVNIGSAQGRSILKPQAQQRCGEDCKIVRTLRWAERRPFWRGLSGGPP